MLGFKFIAAFFFVLCVHYTQYTNASVEVLTKSQVFEDTIFYEDINSFNDGTLVYAICESSTKNTSNCKIVQENYPYDEAAYSCGIKLENKHSNGDGGVDLAVIAHGKDKAVIYWWHRGDDNSIIVKIGTVNLRTCMMNSFQLPNAFTLTFMDLKFMTKFVSYEDDSYEVFYHDPKTSLQRAGLFKIHVDGNGKLINGPESVNVEPGTFYSVLPIATRSPSKGHVIVKKTQMQNRKDLLRNPVLYVELMKPDGTTKLITKYNRDTSSVAAGNNFIGMCEKPQNKRHIVCTQYDENGKALFTTTLSDSSVDVSDIKLYNLSEGGMLTMYGTAKITETKGVYKKTTGGFEVALISENGKQKGKLFLKYSEVSKGLQGVPYIYANDDGKYCATVIMDNRSSYDVFVGRVPVNFKIVSNCFTLNDLLK